jgi:23S rRNA-/tRNA-specific pseudouridylate synthase
MIIIKETNEYLLVWKNSGTPTTSTKQSEFSIINQIIKFRPKLKNTKGYKTNEYGLINRLDNDTAGIIIIAKNTKSFEKYKELMKQERIRKIYLAFSYNLSDKKEGEIDYPIAHHKRKKKKMVIATDNKNFRGKPQFSKTEFEKISQKKAQIIWNSYLKNKIPFPKKNYKKNEFSWILCKIKKGKRHQIRIHLHKIGYPILGDKLYTPPKDKILTKDIPEFHQLFSIGVEFL